MPAGAHQVTEANAAWDKFLAIPNITPAAVSRMICEALVEGEVQSVRYALGRSRIADDNEMLLGIAPQIARSLRNLESDALWKEGKFPGRLEDALTAREKEIWQLCADWISSLPSEPANLKPKILAKCLKAVATGYNPGAIDFFVARGAKFLKTGEDVLRTPLFVALEETQASDLLARLLPHLAQILPALSFDTVDLAIAKQRGHQVEAVSDLYDKEKTSGAMMTDTAFFIRDVLAEAQEVGDAVKARLQWVFDRIPPSYTLPYNQIWDSAAAIADRLANTRQGAEWLPSHADAMKEMVRMLALCAQPAGDVDEQGRAWHSLLNQRMIIQSTTPGMPVINMPMAFLIATHDRESMPFRESILAKALACGGWDVNELVDGRTLLHCAIEWASDTRKPDLVSFLLHSGASTDIKSESGVTPLELATSRGDDDLVQMMSSWRAKQAVAGVLDRARQARNGVAPAA